MIYVASLKCLMHFYILLLSMGYLNYQHLLPVEYFTGNKEVARVHEEI
jgi:hypothetical protein